jgi:hypothetical protein
MSPLVAIAALHSSFKMLEELWFVVLEERCWQSPA